MFDVCGIGNACLDIVAKVDDLFLNTWGFGKGVCTYIDLETANALESALSTPEYIPGGCAANTAACIAALGGKASFIGRIAADKIGDRFRKDMETRTIHFTARPDTRKGAGSTRIFALTTPDTERTFAAYYGVQENLSSADIDEKSIAMSQYLYLDGYALNAPHGIDLFVDAASVAKRAGRLVVFSPSDLSILTKYAFSVSSLLPKTDVLLCNAAEALHMTQETDIIKAIESLSHLVPAGAVTAGAQGAYTFSREEKTLVPAATPPSMVVDTNGAGDAFAGGFLFGIARDHSFSKAAKLGNRCAAQIITHYGARPQGDYRSFLSQSD